MKLSTICLVLLAPLSACANNGQGPLNLVGGNPTTPAIVNVPAGTKIAVIGQSNGLKVAPYMQTAAPRSMVINLAVSGSPISSWSPGGINYQNTILQLRSQRRIDFLVLVSGEYEAEGGPDNTNTAAYDWQKNFEAMVSGFRIDLNSPGLIVVYSRITSTFNGSFLAIVRRAQERENNPTTRMVDLDGISLDPTGNHYPPEGYQAMAQRFIQAMEAN